jgi:predicted kinase
MARRKAPAKRGSRPSLAIVCGLPGTGKTTHAKRLERLLPAIRLCPDEWMEALGLDLYDEHRRSKLEALQWKLAQRLLSRGVSVIIEWGTWARSERDRLRTRARALGATVELYYLTAPADVLLKRIQRRGRENPPITRGKFMRWYNAFEAPTKQELALFDGPTGVGKR